MDSKGDAKGTAGQALFFAGVLLAALIVWHGPLVWGGQVLTGRDLTDQFIPMRDAQLARGWFAGWQPETFSGRPFAGDIQSGILYPPNWLHLAGMSPERGFTLLAMLHLLFGGVGMCLLARLRLSREAALLAGILWTFGGFQILRLTTGVIVFTYAFAWVPWLWLAAERQALVRGRPLMWTAAMAVLGAVQLLAGAPQIVQITWGGLAVWTLGRVLTASSGRERAGIAGGFLAAGVLTLMICAPTLLAVREFQSQAYQRGGEDAWEFLSDGSLHPRPILTWVFPELFSPGNDDMYYWGSSVGYAETNVYLGILPLVAGLFLLLGSVAREKTGWCPPAREDRRWMIALGVLAVTGFLIALGSHGFLFRPLTQWVPTFDYFRVPARWMLWTVAGLAIFSGYGLDRLIDTRGEGSPQHARSLWLAAGGLLLVPAIAMLLFSESILRSLGIGEAMGRAMAMGNMEQVDRIEDYARSSIEWALLMAATAMGLGALWLWRKLNRRTFLVLFLLVALLDLRRFWMPYTEPVPTDILPAELESEAPFHRADASAFRLHFYPETPLIEFATEAALHGRIHYNDTVIAHFLQRNQREFLGERPLVHRIPITRGYQQMQLDSYIDDYYSSFPMPPARNIAAFMPQFEVRDRRFLDAYNVTHFLSYDIEGLGAEIEALGLANKSIVNPGGLAAWSNPHARGWAWLSRDQSFLDADPDSDLGEVAIETRGAQKWAGRIDLNEPAWLHISSPDAEGWQLRAVSTGGVEAQAASTRSIYLSEPGEWTFERRYRSAMLHPAGIAVALLGLLLSVGGILGGVVASGRGQARTNTE